MSSLYKYTAKEEAFCREMVKPGIYQADAYKKAYNPPNSSRKSISESACRLMRRENIKARIAQLRERALGKVLTTREEWLLSLEKLSKADIRKMFGTDGNPVEIPALSDNEAGMIEGFETYEAYGAEGPVGRTKKVKITPKVKALMEFGKAMGWVEPEQVTGPQTIYIRKWVNKEERYHANDTNDHPILDAESGPHNGHDRAGAERPALVQRPDLSGIDEAE
jgi:hypothetical protein